MAKMEVVPPTSPALKQRYKGIWKVFFVLTMVLSAIWLMKSFTSGEMVDQSIMHGTEKALDTIDPIREKLKIKNVAKNITINHVHAANITSLGNHTLENTSLNKTEPITKRIDIQTNSTIKDVSKNEVKKNVTK